MLDTGHDKHLYPDTVQDHLRMHGGTTEEDDNSYLLPLSHRDIAWSAKATHDIPWTVFDRDHPMRENLLCELFGMTGLIYLCHTLSPNEKR